MGLGGREKAGGSDLNGPCLVFLTAAWLIIALTAKGGSSGGLESLQGERKRKELI